MEMATAIKMHPHMRLHAYWSVWYTSAEKKRWIGTFGRRTCTRAAVWEEIKKRLTALLCSPYSERLLPFLDLTHPRRRSGYCATQKSSKTTGKKLEKKETERCMLFSGFRTWCTNRHQACVSMSCPPWMQNLPTQQAQLLHYSFCRVLLFDACFPWSATEVAVQGDEDLPGVLKISWKPFSEISY